MKEAGGRNDEAVLLPPASFILPPSSLIPHPLSSSSFQFHNRCTIAAFAGDSRIKFIDVRMA
jgi:hypothetical protein